MDKPPFPAPGRAVGDLGRGERPNEPAALLAPLEGADLGSDDSGDEVAQGEAAAGVAEQGLGGHRPAVEGARAGWLGGSR
jgi:hypothetical protein